MTSLLSAADAAFVLEDLPLALRGFDSALAAAPTSWEVLSHRAACLARMGRAPEALADADAALALLPSLGEPPFALLHTRGAALMSLGRHAEAARALELAQARLPPSSEAVSTELERQLGLARERLALMAEAPEGEVAPPAAAAAPLSPAVGELGDAVSACRASATGLPAASPPSATVPLPSSAAAAPRPRFDWFQSPTHVTVTVWVRGVVESASSVLASGRECRLALTTGDARLHELRLALAGDLLPGAPLALLVRASKVELRLPKRAPGEAWPALEAPAAGAGEAAPRASAGDAQGTGVGAGGTAGGAAAGLAAPSSAAAVASPYASKKDWRAVEAAGDAEEAGAPKPEGEEALQALFRQIYAGADEDTRKAMVKSFVSVGRVGWGKRRALPPHPRHSSTAPNQPAPLSNSPAGLCSRPTGRRWSMRTTRRRRCARGSRRMSLRSKGGP